MKKKRQVKVIRIIYKYYMKCHFKSSEKNSGESLKLTSYNSIFFLSHLMIVSDLFLNFVLFYTKVLKFTGFLDLFLSWINNTINPLKNMIIFISLSLDHGWKQKSPMYQIRKLFAYSLHENSHEIDLN